MSLHSTIKTLIPSLYCLRITDALFDGMWLSRFGYFTINDGSNVLWKKTGNEFSFDLEACIRVLNGQGESQLVNLVSGIGCLAVSEGEKN
jgi:hypothetical protein